MTKDEKINIIASKRIDLISKKFMEGLSEEEIQQLQQLDEEMNKLCPHVTSEMWEKLFELDKLLKKSEKLRKEIEETL